MTLTAAALRDALKLADDADGNAAAARLLAVASQVVAQYAGAAPDAIANEAATRVAAYLLADDAGARVLRQLKTESVEIEIRAPGSAVRLSGAGALLSPWRVRRAVGAGA